MTSTKDSDTCVVFVDMGLDDLEIEVEIALLLHGVGLVFLTDLEPSLETQQIIVQIQDP